MKDDAKDAPLFQVFQETDRALFFSRGDVDDPRLGELAKRLDSSNSPAAARRLIQIAIDGATPSFVLAGYADDEGIQINGGRLGAAHAPDEVRRVLYKMTPSLSSLVHPTIVDLGNLRAKELGLAERHEIVAKTAQSALTDGTRWIGIGGGHDYGFADASAFCGWMAVAHPTIRPLVINCDAHLDVRPTTKGLSSGTPFFRMLEKFPNVDFAEIGIQSHCNSKAHLEWARSRGARVLTAEELEQSPDPLRVHVNRLLTGWLTQKRPAFLSIDIDGFSSAIAPGCSQSWSTGFLPSDFFPLLSDLFSRLDVRMLSVYEVSPPLDQDNQTSKLAAQIIHRFLF